MKLDRKTTLRLLIPVLIEQFFISMLPMANSIIVSSMGQNSLSGVSVIDQVNLLVGYIVVAIAYGASTVVAQRLGQEDPEGIRRAVGQSYSSSILIAAVCTIFMLLFGNFVAGAALKGADSEMLAIGRTYLRITALSYPFYCFYNNSAALLRGVGKTRQGMYLSLVMNLATFSLSFLFIYILKIGIYGAAVASLSGRIAGAILGYIMVRKNDLASCARDFFALKLDWSEQRNFIRLGAPIGLQSVVFIGARLTMNVFVLDFGSAHMSASVVYTQLLDMQCLGSTAMGLLGATMMGVAKGRGDEEEMKSTMKRVYAFSFVAGLIFCLIPFLCMDKVIALYRLSPEATIMAKKMLTWNPIYIITLTWFTNVTPSSFRGVGDALIPSLITMCCMWGARVLTVVICCTVFRLGAYSVFFGVMVDYIARTVFLGWRYKSGAWLHAQDKALARAAAKAAKSS